MEVVKIGCRKILSHEKPCWQEDTGDPELLRILVAVLTVSSLAWMFCLVAFHLHS